MMRSKYPYLVFLCVMLLTGCKVKQEAKTYQLFVGTYTDGDSEGIYSYSFNADTGELTAKQLAATLPNPSFLAISPDKMNLYAVQETADFDTLGGGVSAFKIEGGNVMIANLEEDGSLQGKNQIINHKTDTLSNPHAHMAAGVKGELFVSDLGLDALKRYQINKGNFIASKQASIALPEGAGPRHFTFSENNEFLYVINELNATITVLQRDAENEYHEIETQSTLSEDFIGDNSCADIHLSKDGKFLYGSNRGENSIVIFKVDAASGKLNLIGREDVRGDWPRNFSIDPTNNFLLVANKKSNNISIFKRNRELGTLIFLKSEKLPSPVCLQFL